MVGIMFQLAGYHTPPGLLAWNPVRGAPLSDFVPCVSLVRCQSLYRDRCVYAVPASHMSSTGTCILCTPVQSVSQSVSFFPDFPCQIFQIFHCGVSAVCLFEVTKKKNCVLKKVDPQRLPLHGGLQPEQRRLRLAGEWGWPRAWWVGRAGR